MARLGESLTMNLNRSMAGSDRRPVASTRKMARCWGSSTRSPRIGRYRVRLAAERSERTLDSRGWREEVAVGVSDAAQGVGGGGGIATGEIDVPPIGGGDELAVGASLSRIAGEGGARAEVLHGLPGGGPNGGVVSGGLVPERDETVSSVGGRTRGFLGKTERMEV